MIMATSVIGSGKEPVIILQPAEVAVVGLGGGARRDADPRDKTRALAHTHAIADVVASLAAVETADFSLWPYPYFMSVWTSHRYEGQGCFIYCPENS